MPRLSQEELDSRRNGMGSTCVVEACGLAPWKGAGPMRLFCEKLGILSPDDAEEDEEDAETLEWGHIQEPVIADWYERTRGVKLMLGGQIPSPDHSFMWATLDRKVVGESRLLEIKNVGSPKMYAHWDTSSQDGIPRYVRGQVNTAMHYSGIHTADVVACIGGRPPHVWTVFYDPELAALMVGTGVHFWREYVLKGQAPPLDHTPASKVYLRSKYPDAHEDREIVEVTDTELDLLGQSRVAAASVIKTHKQQLDRLDAMILNRIGHGYGVRGSGWQMTWSGKDGKRRQRFTSRDGADE